MHRGSAGIQALNGELQAVLNPIDKARATGKDRRPIIVLLSKFILKSRPTNNCRLS